jgi:hypothetical protein
MGMFDPIAATAVCTAVLLLTLLMWRRRHSAPRAKSKQEALDTVQAWPPEAARVLTIGERRAYELLRTALPGFLVLAQVPLGRFLRVPTRHSHAEWMQRVGSLSADLLVCNAGSKVLAVIDIQPAGQSERSRRRHERMARVLTAAGICVQVWDEDKLPSAADVRVMLGNELDRSLSQGSASVPATTPQRPTPSRGMPLIPVAEMEELLAQGDQAAHDLSMEPVPSAFFDDLEVSPQGARGGD